jgi:peptidoglycan/xylan/chitin deacetylase (PgdA/CDA1 family)
MSAVQLREIHALGMTIGSHTVSHPKLAALGPERQRRELADSKAALEDLLGEQVGHLCYPYGSFDLDAVRAAAETGYLSATTCLRGLASPAITPCGAATQGHLLRRQPHGLFLEARRQERPQAPALGVAPAFGG